MKKIVLLLSLLASLSLGSCGGNSNNNKDTLSFKEKLLDGLQKGYRLEYYLNTHELWNYDTPETYDDCYFVEFGIRDDYIQYKHYVTKIDNENNVKIDYSDVYQNITLTHGEGETDSSLDVMKYHFLNLDNKIYTVDVLDTFTDEPILWNDYGMINGFNYIKDEELTETSNPNEYIIDFSKIDNETAKYNFSVQFYGNYYADVSTILIKTDGSAPTEIEVTFDTLYETVFRTDVVTDVSINGKFTKFNTDDTIINIAPLEGNEDETFLNAMETLKKHNYWERMNYYTSDFPYDGPYYISYQTSIMTNSKDMLYSTYYSDGSINYNGGYYEVDDSHIQEFNIINNKYYKNLGPIETTLEEDLLPSFNISSLFFKKVNHKYVLDRDLYYTGYDSSYLFSSLCDLEVYDLEIVIRDEVIKFTNIYPPKTHYSSKKVEVVFSLINEIEDDLINIDEVKSNTGELSFKDIYKNNKYYEYLIEVISEDLLEQIPTLRDNHSNFSLYVDNSGYVEFQIACKDDEDGEQLVSNYTNILCANTLWSVPLAGEYDIYTTERTIDSVTIQLEYFYYDSTFVISPSIKE